ncbi:MAG TPA: carbohydrate porin [Terriglobales bacterium]|nr:carbohydrate porin [Terriglobales bacterium]
MSDGARGHARRLMAAALLAPTLCALGATRATADEPLLGSWMKRWIAEPPAAGNWFGARDVLSDWGIKPSISYATDLMASVAGGQRRGQAYAGQLAVDVTADLGKLAGLKGLTFDVGADWGSGTDLSRDIGNTFTVAQYFEGQEVRLTNMYLQQSLFDGRVDLKAGRFSTGADFLTSPIDVSFVNEALNPILLAVQQNVPGVTAYPNVTWGGRVRMQPTAALSLSAGAFYSDPALNQLTANGTEFGISSSAGYFVVGEAGYLVNGESGAAGLPGRYRMGAYYDSNQYTFLDNPGRQQTGNYGVFVMGEQMVFREGGPGSATGLTLFGAVIYAPQASINPMPWFASAGASYQGLVSGRERDIAAFALYYGGFSGDLPGQSYELVLEWTYAIAIGRRLTVQPDIQYVINPGGVSSVGNAVVLGVQLTIEF